MNKWFWFYIIFIVIPIMGASLGINGSSSTIENLIPSQSKNVAPHHAAFDGASGITLSAEIRASIFSPPKLKISITNKANKKISAFQLLVISCNTDQKKITGWTSQKKLYTSTAIEVGQSDVLSYQLSEYGVKTWRLYLYSVSFFDGTEWGDKHATEPTIKMNGIPVEVREKSFLKAL